MHTIRGLQFESRNCFFFKNGPYFASFSFIFGLFKQTLQILQQINVKQCPSCIRCRDLNSQPSDYESPPLTTRPGLLPYPDIVIEAILLCLVERGT